MKWMHDILINHGPLQYFQFRYLMLNATLRPITSPTTGSWVFLCSPIDCKGGLYKSDVCLLRNGSDHEAGLGASLGKNEKII